MDRSGATMAMNPWRMVAAVLSCAAILVAGGCGGSPSGSSLRSVQWSHVAYPVSCTPEQPPKAEDVEYQRGPSGTTIAVVLVQCSTEDGTGGAGLLLYDKAASSEGPHLAQVLLSPTDGWVPGAPKLISSTRLLITTSTMVELKVAGYRGDAARCCPNVFATLTWKWSGHSFRETGVEPSHNTSEGTSVPPTSLPVSGTWKPTTISGAMPLVSVSCSSASFCVALGIGPSTGASASIYSHGTWGPSHPIDPHTYQDSISCPTSDFCLAVDSLPGISPEGYQGGYAFIYDAGTWSSLKRVDPVSLGSVSCASVSFCVATGDGGSVYAYTNGRWSSRVELPGAEKVIIESVSCTTAPFCMAVGLPNESFGTGWYSTYENGRWSPGTTFPIVPHSFLQAVSCASDQLCVAVDGSGNAYAYTGQWAAGQKVTSETETPSVSCPSTSRCFVAGDHDVNTYLGNQWAGTAALSGADLRAMSCPSVSFCVAVGDSGGTPPNAFIYSSP